MDPDKVFENEIFRRLSTEGEENWKIEEGCGLESRCTCSGAGEGERKGEGEGREGEKEGKEKKGKREKGSECGEHLVCRHGLLFPDAFVCDLPSSKPPSHRPL